MSRFVPHWLEEALYPIDKVNLDVLRFAHFLALAVVTMFFVWAKGKVAAWLAGMGLLLMAVFVPVAVFALFLPLVKIISEMGNM